jgi:hypothetical protein
MTSPKKYALHSSLSQADKLRALKRANAILSAGYTNEVTERRTGYNMVHMRKWAEELGFPLIITKKSKYKPA